MPGVSIWNGSAFVTPSALKLWNGSAFADISGAFVWNGAWERVWPLHNPVSQTFNSTGTFTPPSWWRDGIDYIDYIIIGGGGEGGAASGGSGGGGQGGSVKTGTIQTLNGYSYLTASPGNGGSGNNTTGASGAYTYLFYGNSGTFVDSAKGGNGGVYGGQSGSNIYGKSPGTTNYQGMTYVGGAQQTTLRGVGNAPGGGGAGTSTAFTYGGVGANGGVMVQARQNTTQ